MEKKQYIAPTLTSVTFKIEHCYAFSNAYGYGPDHDFLGLLRLESDLAEDYNTQGQQNWHESDYFGTSW